MTAGMYRVCDPAGSLLYIGSAKNVENRLAEHGRLRVAA